ncbi:hypothetical protein [Microbacterium oleivorans]|uniref:PknH-like extracellular domain-containing protein n=1 Tax=Microbacterium oleivorans TaxID=273677 RepID=A0A7D5FA01_9MICO|nr:hypothetical protein [Microbacterium oleivorans]QLD12369.1 hypothetical protein HW566_11645 [Microbacterium oleivorans]
MPLVTKTPAPSKRAIARTHVGVIVAAVGLVALAGCTPADSPDSGAPTSSSVAPEASATPTVEAGTGSAALSDADLEALFTGIQFQPGQYDTTAAMLESIYPGLTVSDASCLAPFGAGWESAAASAVEFGTSNDRSMTAVVAATADDAAATDLVTQADDAIARCADGQELFAMQGTPVTTSVEPFDLSLSGADESRGWRVTGDVGGTPFALVGATVRVGQNAIALVGWDPATNTDYVPQATQLFIDRLPAAG